MLKSQAYHLLNVEDQLHLLPIAYDMNLQDILDPIHALFSWTFDLLAATNDIGNNVLIIVISVFSHSFLDTVCLKRFVTWFRIFSIMVS